MKDYLTLDDVDFKGKTVLCRVDINCPIDPVTRKVTDHSRIRAHACTLDELARKGAKVIVMSHQGRPGETDFISLEGHAELMGRCVKHPISFVDHIFGKEAISRIRRMKEGEILLLENVRFYSEEMLNRPADALAKVLPVKALSGVADYFVNDAFGAIHRSQASLVGFGELLPAIAGRVIEGELESLDRVFDNPNGPVVFILGGVKVRESISVINNLMINGKADKVLTGGLLGNLLLIAKGYDLGGPSTELLRGKGIHDLLPEARELMSRYGSRIETPVDVAVRNSGRKDVHVSELPSPHAIADIGSETVGRYCKTIEDAGTIVMNSPLGMYEHEGFRHGTERILSEVAKRECFKVVGGGHVGELVGRMGLSGKFNHVSTGGRATLYYLSGEETPVISMLRRSRQKHLHSISGAKVNHPLPEVNRN